MIDREYTLNRLKSRSMTPQEFNYEILSAPPIFSMFTVEDIQQLNYIAKSAVYSAKLKEKYEMIDKIMANRGFEKLVSGTNRVAYQPTFANNFIVKVAYDSVALKDSIREYKNQYLIKPFCTKVFEVTPCGTLGVFEKVNPITNRKEYISMAADIYKLLSEFIIGQYIIDDIGTEYFNNIGFRNGFGAVVLDFPYVYEVDGKKLWCNKPGNDHGYCNGEIDYDLGFNKLMCRKCGAIYKPFELAKKIEYNNPTQFVRERKDTIMKFRLSGGSLGLKNEEIATGDFRNPVNAIKSNMMNKKVEKQLEEEKNKTVNGVAAPKEKVEEPVEEEKVEEVVEEEEITDLEPVDVVEEEDEPVDVVEDEAIEEEAPEEKKEVKKAFEINEEDRGKGDLGYVDDKEDIGRLLAEINNLYYYSDATDEDRTKIVQNCCEFLEAIFADNLEIVINMFADILRKKKNIKDDIIKDFLEKNSCSVNNQFIKLLLASGNYYLGTEIKKCGPDEDGENIVFEIAASIFKTKTDKVVYAGEDLEASIGKVIICEALGFNDDEPAEEISEEFYESEEADGLDLANAVTLSKKDLFPNEKNGKIIVIKNDDGSYLTLNNKILAIDHIDDRNIKDIAVVAKDWYEDALEKIELLKEAPVGSLPEEEEVVEEEEASGEEE
jgi:hypothetical protein